MSRAHRILARMVPSPRCTWLLAHEAELAAIQGRLQRWRWNLGLVPIFGRALVSQLRHDPRSYIGGALSKTVVATLSILNLALGIGMVVLYVSETDPPLFLIVLILALLVQGSYSLATVFGAFCSHSDVARHLQLAGSTLALVVGTVLFVSGFLANIDPINTDPEYGPMTIALVIAGHGLASLFAFMHPGSNQRPTTG